MPVSFLSLLAPPLFSTQHWTWHEGLLHLSRSKFGCRTCSSPGKVCRWNEVWQEPVGAAGLAGSGPLMMSPWSRGAGTEASRQHAWFIKSHQEHRLGTAVIYSYFSLVKCYWLFYTKGSLFWMGCTGIQFTSIFCQLGFPPCPPTAPHLLLKLYMVLREEAIFYLRGKKELTALKRNLPS